MQIFELLKGSDVEAMRTELKLSRDKLMAATTFTGKSAARINNIERKDSWNPGDREVVARAFWALYGEAGRQVPDILSWAECPDGWEAHVVHPGHQIEMERAAKASEAEYAEQAAQLGSLTTAVGSDVVHATNTANVKIVGGTVAGQPIADVKPCPHAGSFRYDPTQGKYVCVDCDEETPQAAAAREAREAMGLTTVPEVPVGGTLDVAGTTFTKIGDDPFPTRENPITIDASPTEADEEWEETLAAVGQVAPQEPPVPASAPLPTAPEVEADYTLTHSELATHARCPRKWWLAYYRSLGPRALDLTSARATGGRIHRALEMSYPSDPRRRVSPKDALERVIVEDWTKIVEVVTDPTELALVKERFDAANALERAMIEGYEQWIAETGADADYEVVGPEQVLATTFDVEVDGKKYLVALLGKLDARLRRRSDGALLFIDHKTVQSLTDVVPTLRQNEQMLIYVLLETLNATSDERVAGALYNMLRKVKRTARANPPFYDRIEVRHNQHELGSMFARVKGRAETILRTTDQLDAGRSHWEVAYPNPTPDCKWDCDFFRVCPLFDDGSPGVEEMLASVYTEVDPLERYDGIAPTRSTHVGEESK